jgi:hypothetical protein
MDDDPWSEREPNLHMVPIEPFEREPNLPIRE